MKTEKEVMAERLKKEKTDMDKRIEAREKRQQAKEDRAVSLIKWSVISVFGIILLFSIFYVVPAGHRGVLMTFGDVNLDSQEEGLHVKIPFAQSVKKFDVRTTKLEEVANAASKDLQDVQSTVALNYHISPAQAPVLYRDIGPDFMDRIIRPSIQESMKAISAKYTAEELITKRASVKADARELLKEKLATFYIIVDDFNIVDFQFSEEFDKAIESKVTAEQLMLKAEMDLERIKVEKEQMITQAEAEAESLRLQKMEITPDLIKLRQIEMQKEAIAKWNGVMPYVTGGAMPFFDVGSLGLEAGMS